MNAYFKLLIPTVMTVLGSVLFWLLEKKTPFGKLSVRVRQLCCGILFGLLSVMGTEFGIEVPGAVLNVRDAAPLCAGLIFGAPAGILSGIIGGLERYLAVAWGAGAFTRIACTAATIFAGVLGAWLRRFLFEDKRPAWYYGIPIGVIIETFHMLLVFATHPNDTLAAYHVIQICTVPMFLMNTLTLVLALIAVSRLERAPFHRKPEKTPVSASFQKGLLVCIAIVFSVTGLLTYQLLTAVSNTTTDNLLLQNIKDVRQDISDASDSRLLELTKRIATELNLYAHISDKNLIALADFYEVSEINIVNRKGIIANSTNPDFVGYDMRAGTQSSSFLRLFNGKTAHYVQPYQGTSYDSTLYRKYAATLLNGGGFVQVGYDAACFQSDLATQVSSAAANRHIGETGYLIICDENQNIVSSQAALVGRPLSAIGIEQDLSTLTPKKHYTSTVYKEDCFFMYDTSEGYYILAVQPKSEALLSRNMSIYFTVFMELLIFAALFILVYFLTQKRIVTRLHRVNASLSKITNGDLEEVVDVRQNLEFAELSDDINSTVATLRHYIDEAAERIAKELETAKAIQTSTLPRIFPPYPGRKEFDIFASMLPAKEVGGDFYDFYLLGRDRLVFLIADVSGKGIPAAMFMMTAKTTIKNLVEAGHPVDEAFTMANDQLCANNEAGMFVTAWMGILNLQTGLVSFVNAGHNPPVIKHGDGSFTYLKSRAGFVLAGMDGFSYRKNELQLEHGDVLFLYTDGVTEATNSDTQLYGEQRLLTALDSLKDNDMQTLCRDIKADVDAFVKDAPQFDDITMLGLRFN